VKTNLFQNTLNVAIALLARATALMIATGSPHWHARMLRLLDQPDLDCRHRDRPRGTQNRHQRLP
jgi:hypothetical protein